MPRSTDKTTNPAKAARTGAVKGQRLSLRVEDGDRELFDRAAERLLADRTRFQLSPDAWEELVAIVDRDAKPNPQLARLFA